ncbi:glycosyltransferase [Pedobacter sp. JCM 36344]|uniref:glycosyltransferase n=1 Tax=Pedobacter sp. JCM 36344 TaxID=3374280 RepID=UPI00397B5E0A
MILHIITTTDVGGTEMMLEKLITNSVSDEEHLVISLTSVGKIGDRLLSKGIQVQPMHLDGISDFPRCVKDINNVIKKYKPNLIQTWLYHSDFIGAILGLYNRIPVVWNIRQTKFAKTSPLSTLVIMRLCVIISYFVPKKIICAAYASAKSHVRFGYDKKKILVIPNGFDDKFANYDLQSTRLLKERYSIHDTDLIVGIVGRFHPDKDHLNFVNSSMLVARSIENSKFLMVGRNLDTENDVLMGWIKSVGLEDRYILLGEQTDISSLLALMDVFCLSSLSEGFPNVLGEAMLMERPCVSTECGDAEQIIGDCGVLVKVNDSFRLSAAIIKLLNLSSEERKAIGIKARSRILEKFSLIKTVNSYLLLYKKLKK